VPESCITRNPLGVLLLLLAVFPLNAGARDPASTPVRVDEFTRAIPARSLEDLTGSQFVHYVSKMDARDREQAILGEISKGNLPDFLRKLVPVKLRAELASGKDLIATIFVTPDYLAIGSDADFLRIPMNLHTAVAVAQRFGFVLPTRKMVDAIYQQSRYHLAPQPLPAGPQMRSTDYYWTHNELIEDQTRAIGAQLGELVSGDKKDVVMSNRLTVHLGRIAIYGWHRGVGEPIQPLSTVHGANYADYSHGIRLVSEWAVIDGKLQSVREILQDPSTAAILSDEGPIRVDGRLLAAQWDDSAMEASRNN
jgi:hypothetical protein